MSPRTFFGIDADRVKVRDPRFGRGRPKLTFYDKNGSRIRLDKRAKAHIKGIDPREIEARRGDWEGNNKLRDDVRYSRQKENPNSYANEISAPITTSISSKADRKQTTQGNTLKASDLEKNFVARDPGKQGDVTALHVFKDKV